MIKILLIYLFCLNFLAIFVWCSSRALAPEQSSSDYWQKLSKKALYEALENGNKVKKAKNVILFLGDGMGMPTISAARLLRRQISRDYTKYLFFEQFNYSALIKTYNLDYPVPDSAATGTAFCTGVKANTGTIGVNGNVERKNNDCEHIQRNSVESVYKKAAQTGKSVGIVTTASITDATPAATYANVNERNFEYQSPGSWMGSKCKDIARQLIEDNDFNVILGGGRKNFLPAENLYLSHDRRMFEKEVGQRKDKRNLLEEWLTTKRKRSDLTQCEYKMISSRNELISVNFDNLKYLFGLFSKNHMKYDKERSETDDLEPSLKEMTEAAIKVLMKNKNGFFLMVEGAKIDKAHHANLAYYSLYDVLAFEDAIMTAYNLVNLDETLIIVTADHSHSFNFNSDQTAHNDIFTFNQKLDKDNFLYTSLIYSTGPGSKTKKNETIDDIKKPGYQQMSAIKLDSALHGGDDVAAYATGPGSNLLRGSQEQTMIAHIMEFSACIGDYAKENHCGNSANGLKTSLWLLLFMLLFKVIFT